MKTLQELLDLRFGDIGAVPETLAGNEAIRRLAGRGVVRRFKPEPLPVAVLDTLAAVALSSPSKSDLQQRDILIVEDAAIRARVNALVKDQDWIPGCPHLLVFLGNNRRPSRRLLQRDGRCGHRARSLRRGGRPAAGARVAGSYLRQRMIAPRGCCSRNARPRLREGGVCWRHCP